MKKIKPQLKIPQINLTRSRINIDSFLATHTDENDPWRIFRIMTEFVMGFDFLREYKKAVTIFGSALFEPTHPTYKQAEKLAGRLAEDGFAIVTGGGPGIMEAANKGAKEAKGKSVGLGIKIPTEQGVNPYAEHYTIYKYFFTRKVMLVYASQIYVFLPGGFGTLDEFFELVNLVKTQKIEPVPIILVDKKFWTPLLDWINNTLVENYKTVSKAQTDFYKLVDTPEEAYSLINQLIKNHGNKTLQHAHKKTR